MAIVYLAGDLRHGRPVALKVLLPSLSSSLSAERFLREIRTAARLQHPHVLSVHDSGEAGGQLWFTMPYVEGETLRRRLQREGQLSLSNALRIAREMADGLDFAHRHGVIHRDVKPENILLSEGHALVADFGISRALAMDGGEALTETGVSVGTPSSMSPEQASGQPVEARPDTYPLGGGWTRGPTSTRSAVCCTRCWPASRRSRDRPRRRSSRSVFTPTRCRSGRSAPPCPNRWTARPRGRWQGYRPTGSPLRPSWRVRSR